MGVRKTNCRGRLARSGMVAGSLPQLANVLTIQELQNCERRTRINSSPVKKLTYLFGEALTRAYGRGQAGGMPSHRLSYVREAQRWHRRFRGGTPGDFCQTLPSLLPAPPLYSQQSMRVIKGAFAACESGVVAEGLAQLVCSSLVIIL